MKKKIAALVPLIALLTSCPIVNPIYPQDELDLSEYRDPISLDWTNDLENEPEDALFDDEEELRTYLNNPRAAIKEVTSAVNVYRRAGTLRIGQRVGEREGELIISLKNVFAADALAVHVTPYFYESFSAITGKTDTFFDSFAISINERDYIDIGNSEEDIILTFRFQQPIEQIIMKTKSGRGYISSLEIFQLQ